MYGAIFKSWTARVARLLPSNAALALKALRISSRLAGFPLIAISIMDSNLIYSRLGVNKKVICFAI